MTRLDKIKRAIEVEVELAFKNYDSDPYADTNRRNLIALSGKLNSIFGVAQTLGIHGVYFQALNESFAKELNPN